MGENVIYDRKNTVQLYVTCVKGFQSNMAENTNVTHF